MKIGFGTFFDFNDDTPIKEALGQFTRIEKAYEGMIDGIEDSNKRLAGEFIELEKAADDLAKTVGGMGSSLQKNEKLLLESADASEKLVKDFNALKIVEAENAKQLAVLTNQLALLTKAKKEAADATENEEGSLNDLRAQLTAAEKAYKEMGEATDESIKEEQLEKVRSLANAYSASNDALKEARKGVIVAAGSYDELNKQVIEAKKELKSMEGSIDGNSKEFKELQKFVKEGTDKLKDFDKAIGDNTRNVGDYTGALTQQIPVLGGIIQKSIAAGDGFKGIGKEIKALTKSVMLFLATPLGLVLAAIAAALGSLMAYFKGSIKGQDDFNKVLMVGQAILETLMDVVEAVGEALFTAITEPKEVLDSLIALFKPLTNGFVKAFSEPVETIKELGRIIWDKIVNRIKAIPLIAEAAWKIISSGFQEGYKDLANGLLQSATGVEKLVDKAEAAFEVVIDGVKTVLEGLKRLANETEAEFQKRFALALEIATLENKLRKDRIADILDDAQTELKVSKLLLESKDKLRFSDEERFNKLRQANALLQEQLEGDLQLARDEIRLQQLIIKQNGETYEERQKLVELQAAEVAIQTKFMQERKRRQQAEIALIREIEKETLDRIKREEDAETALWSFRLGEVIRVNQKILAEEESSLADRLDAIANMDLAQEQLLKDNQAKLLGIAKEAALARIELDGDTIDKIYSNESISIKDRIAQERAAKEELLHTDQAYVDETVKITEEYNAKTAALLEESKKLAEDNVFKVLQRDADRFAAKLDTSINDQLRSLNDAFANGDISSIKDFEKQKLAIQEQGQRDSLTSQIDYLKQRAALLQEGSKERAQVEKTISDYELQLSEINAQKRIEVESRVAEATKNLKQAVFNSAMDLINSANEAADADREARLDKLSEDESKQLALVKDNEQAKALIQADFAARKKKIDDEQKAANRRRAIFEKALAITEIAINTAKGVSQALGDYPPPASFVLAALVAAAGAVQVATVAAKPIPSFFKGTSNSPEGLAIVNELGPEIIIDKSGKARMIGTDGPTLTYLKGGSKVIPADESARQLEYMNMENGTNLLRNGVEVVKETAALNMSKVTEAIHQNTEAVTGAIATIPQDYYDDKGFRRYERSVNGRVLRLDNKYKFK